MAKRDPSAKGGRQFVPMDATWVASIGVPFVAFVADVLAVQLTRAQRVLAAVSFDGVDPCDLRGADAEIARELFGAVEHVAPAARAAVGWVLGARSGKSYLVALFMLWRALTADLSRLAPGELAAALAVAPDLRLAGLVIRYALGAARSHPSIARLIVAESAEGFTVRRPDGREVEVTALPATRGGSALRGRSLVCAVLDECAFFRSGDSYEVNDTDIYRAVAPRVMPGGHVLIVSTPWADAGLLYELHRDNFGKPAAALVAHAPTRVMREGDAHVLAVVERERQRDARNAAREFDAQFTAADSALITADELQRCVDRGRERSAPIDTSAGGAYAIGLDVGLRRDRTAIVAAHREIRSRDDGRALDLIVVDAVVLLKPGLLKRIEIADVIAALRRLHASYPGPVMHDMHYSDAIGPALDAARIEHREVAMAPAAQQKRVDVLLSRVAAGTVRLPDAPELLAELRSARLHRHAGGRFSVEAKPGQHDDALDALLLAVELASQLGPLGGDFEVVWPTFIHFDREAGELHGAEPRYFRRLPSGEREPCSPPPGTVGFAAWVDAMLARGIVTPDIEAHVADEARARGLDPRAELARRLGLPPLADAPINKPVCN